MKALLEKLEEKSHQYTSVLIPQISTYLDKSEDIRIEDEFRASEMPYFCPRRFLLLRNYQANGSRLYRPGNEILMATFDQGKAIHDLVQQKYFRLITGIYGDWQCEKCGDIVRDKSDWWGHVCKICAHNSYRYKEQGFYNQQLRLGGHVDGFIKIPGTGITLGIEIKSISRTRFNSSVKTESALAEHQVQCAAYSILTGIKEWRVLYFVKEWNSPPIAERIVLVSDKMRNSLIKRLRSVLEFLDAESGEDIPIPGAVCSPPEKVQSKCPVYKDCMCDDVTDGFKKDFPKKVPAKVRM